MINDFHQLSLWFKCGGRAFAHYRLGYSFFAPYKSKAEFAYSLVSIGTGPFAALLVATLSLVQVVTSIFSLIRNKHQAKDAMGRLKNGAENLMFYLALGVLSPVLNMLATLGGLIHQGGSASLSYCYRGLLRG